MSEVKSKELRNIINLNQNKAWLALLLLHKMTVRQEALIEI